MSLICRYFAAGLSAARRAASTVAVVACATLVDTASTAADTIYFADIFVPSLDDGSIRQVSTDGSNLQTVLPIGGGLRSLDIDRAANKLYWVDVDNFAIRRANLDGSNVEDLITSGLVFPSAIAVDSAGGKFYWGDQSEGFIHRANLDGTGVEPLFATPFNRGLAIDTQNSRLYWSTSISGSSGAILRSDFTGGNMEVVIPSLGANAKPGGIALDISGGKLYWTDPVATNVRRANLDGSNIESLIAPQGYTTRGIRLDLVNGWIYWGQDYNDEPTLGRIMRMRLDGTLSEVVLWEVGFVNDLVLVSEGGEPCVGDVNGDGAVDLADLATLLANFGGPGGLAQGDIDGNGMVDLADLATLLARFGSLC